MASAIINEPWHKRARKEYSLRSNPPGRECILMHRWCDENGLNSEGIKVAWRDIATIPDFMDARNLLDALRKSSVVR